jgi:hypothetical protein
VSLAVCGIVATLACAGQILAQATPSPPPTSAIAVLTDPCGGYQELLKKYLSASPCVFVRGQASIQATYSGTNVPVAFTQTLGGHTLSRTESSHSFGYPGALLNVGVTPSSQITVVLPSFSQETSTHTGTVAGTTDMEFRYKQLVYWNRTRGILGGVLATYKAPTGSPGLTAEAPSYEINPLLNLALNKARSIAENLSFPLTNAGATSSGQSRTWSFAPQAVTVWRSPGATLVAVIAQYNASTHITYLTLNTAQLLSRNVQLQATYGGNDSTIEYASPVEGIGPASGTAYSRSFTVGASYLIGHSEVPPK